MVAADASLPILKNLKLRGPSELSAMVAPVVYRIEQWQSCGLAGLPEDVEVHLVGLYKGPDRLRFQLGPSGHATNETDVAVGRTPYPVNLVLSAYDPVVWRVGYTLHSSIAGVLVSGYHSQALIGVPRDFRQMLSIPPVPDREGSIPRHGADLRDAEVVLAQLGQWLEDYNRQRPIRRSACGRHRIPGDAPPHAHPSSESGRRSSFRSVSVQTSRRV